MEFKLLARGETGDEDDNEGGDVRQASATSLPSWKHGQMRSVHKLVLVCMLVTLAVAMFLGGWFAGYRREEIEWEKHHQTGNSDKLTDKKEYWSFSNEHGHTLKVPVLQGSVPVLDFLQCNFADGPHKCQSGNPMITPKGTVLVTPYKFNGKTSFIFTATGSEYGEASPLLPSGSTGRRKREATSSQVYRQLLLSICSGFVITPQANDYDQFEDMLHAYSKGFQMLFNYSTQGSHSHVFTLSESTEMELSELRKIECKVALQAGEINQIVAVYSADTSFSRSAMAVHSTGMHLSVRYEGHSDGSSPEGRQEESSGYYESCNKPVQVAADVQVQTVRHTDAGVSRWKRSPGGGDPASRAVMFKTLHQETGQPLSTVLVYVDQRYGGANGTVTFDVTNHTSQCRSRYTMLYHEALSDGKNLINATDHQTFLFHHQDAGGHVTVSAWQSVRPRGNEIASTIYPLLGGAIPARLDCFTDEVGDLWQRLVKANESQRLHRSRRDEVYIEGSGDNDNFGKILYHGVFSSASVSCTYTAYRAGTYGGRLNDAGGMADFNDAQRECGLLMGRGCDGHSPASPNVKPGGAFSGGFS